MKRFARFHLLTASLLPSAHYATLLPDSRSGSWTKTLIRRHNIHVLALPASIWMSVWHCCPRRCRSRARIPWLAVWGSESSPEQVFGKRFLEYQLLQAVCLHACLEIYCQSSKFVLTKVQYAGASNGFGQPRAGAIHQRLGQPGSTLRQPILWRPQSFGLPEPALVPCYCCFDVHSTILLH